MAVKIDVGTCASSHEEVTGPRPAHRRTSAGACSLRWNSLWKGNPTTQQQPDQGRTGRGRWSWRAAGDAQSQQRGPHGDALQEHRRQPAARSPRPTRGRVQRTGFREGDGHSEEIPRVGPPCPPPTWLPAPGRPAKPPPGSPPGTRGPSGQHHPMALVAGLPSGLLWKGLLGGLAGLHRPSHSRMPMPEPIPPPCSDMGSW